MPSLKKRGKKHHSVQCKKMFFICLGFYTLFQETSLPSSLGCSRNTSKIHVIKLIVVFSFYDVLWSRLKTKSLELKPKMTEVWQQWPNLGPFEMCQGWAGLGFVFFFFRNSCAAELGVAVARRVYPVHLRPVWVNRAGALKERRFVTWSLPLL